MLTKTKAELLAAALDRNLLIAPVTTTRDVLELDHLAERSFWDRVDLSGAIDVDPAVSKRAANLRMCGPFARMSRTPLVALQPPPRLGQHTAAVMNNLERRPATTGGEQGLERPLSGIKVLDFMWALAGPGATRMLADLGATVVKIESETYPDVLRGAGPFRGDDGDPEGAFQFHSLNAGKLGVALDMKHDQAKEVILDLARWADVVTDSFSAGAMARWGLGPEDLHAVNPNLVILQSNLMGDTGPMAHYAGFGTMAAAIAGFYPITGWPDRAPAGPFTAFTDYISPRLAAAAILAALDHRQGTGEGQYIDYSQYEGALHFLGPAFLDDELNGRATGRHGNRDRHMAPHGVYAASGDDQWVAIACETDQHWRTLAQLIGADDATSALPVAQRHDQHDRLDSLITDWTTDLAPFEVQALLIEAGVPAHAVQRGRDCVADPQLQHRDVFVEVPHSSYGHSWAEAQAFLLSESSVQPIHSAPMFGEHAYEVLCGLLGYDPDAFAELAVADVLR